MKELYHNILKLVRKLYSATFGEAVLNPIPREDDPEKAASTIVSLLTGDTPCMIARFGSTELSALINYLGVSAPRHSALRYIRGQQPEWWWNKNVMAQMQRWSGFFPPTEANMMRFGQMMMDDMQQLDMLGSWVKNEAWFTDRLRHVKVAHLRLLEPFWAKEPWTRYLKGKRVVVVHPFSDDIIAQYNNRRDKLFDNPDMLPTFTSLRVIKAVQSLGGEETSFKDWFEALQWMKDEMDSADYDVALIGCGAYGFPLAAHAKRTGHKAVHLGGALQLLFGIRGRRWEDPNYGVKEWGIPYSSYSNLMNDFWVRPGETGRPKNANDVEGACYW